MTEPQTVEEAHKALWEAIAEGNWGAVEHVEDAVRALALAVLEEARRGEGAFTKKRYPTRWRRLERLQRRIEALGK